MALEFSDTPQSVSVQELLLLLRTSSDGLTVEEAHRRLMVYGKNRLEEEETSKATILLRQFKNPLVYILGVASMITLLVGEWKDLIVILVIVAVNGVIGFSQELKAETSINALKKLTESKVNVVREGRLAAIPSSELVPGDCVTISEGDLNVADIRLLESHGLLVDESSLTGESVPVLKDHSVLLPPNALPFELTNILLSGTMVVRGYGKGVVIRTGCHTYLATIAERAKGVSPDSPLTKATKSFARRYVSLLIVLLSALGVIDYLQSRALADTAYLLVAQLVSSVPEGLPLVITVVMVVGAITLSKKKTLTRHLPSVETLGSTTVIASDKTGTITEGRLTVKEVYPIDKEKLRLAAALCNDAHGTTGDPIDIALTKWVGDYEEIRSRYPRFWSYPFDTKLKLMATGNLLGDSRNLFVKGAYEELRKIAVNVTAAHGLEESLNAMAGDGLRVLAFGVGQWTGKDPSSWKLEIVGLIGFLDPPKEEIAEAVQSARRAGIRVVMITGDYPLTAKAVAGEVGIWHEGDRVITGKEIEELDDSGLFAALKNTSVLARILPEHKYRVVKVLQDGGEIVAVTGDGVNDVPALKAADLGIAMGTGTEAAKSVSKMVILDSNMRVIVDAVRKGRVIADNVRKVIYYLVSTGTQEISLLSLSVLAGLPLPLYPIQILWINLVTDGVQDKAFPFTKEEGEVMNRSPRKPEKQFFDTSQILRTLLFGLTMGLACFLLFRYLLQNYPYELAVSVTFTSVVLAQWVNGIQAQKEREPFFKNPKRSITINPYIYLGVCVGLILQLFAIYVAPDWLNAVPIPVSQWRYPIMMSLFAFAVVESRKWIQLLLGARSRVSNR